ncbi:MAG: ABC-F family ATPase [Chlamydiae bacterium CG10_big_fil_rev_8_21_14_0_10_35_9]|nr:MAG: ABC-F family ATPase [Chlamydiae bacterium CG10_big_fil_rev_8_21_14_0_10_35_9]
MITLDSLSKKLGTRVLFDDVTVTFNEGARYGLTGPNGAGKSTLLKIIMGQEPPTAGHVSLPEKVGYLKQNIEEFADFTAIETVVMGNARLWDALSERDRLYEVEMTDEVGMRLGDLEEIIADENGYTAEVDAEVLLIGMGIPKDAHEEKMHSLPTDWQFRILLCQALFGDPQALILDEPTNHLDLESITWLQEFLCNFKGALIVVSHDKYFLNAITTHIADIDYETVITYPGNYDQMLVAKTSVREKAELENKAREKKVAQLKEFVAKFGAGTRASQVQSRVKEIQKLQPQELKKSNIQRPYIRFSTPETNSGQVVFNVKKLCKSFDDKKVLHNASFEILRGDKIAVIGSNGKGKTTLLKLLSGIYQPDSGQIIAGHQVDIGYFPQNHEEMVDKTQDTSLFDWLKNVKPGLYDQDVRGVLGKLLFGGDDAFKPVKALSGGETARLLLAKLMLNSPNTIILDEPNNHLDLESVSALAWGLEDYKGTAIVASHDRNLVNNFATKIIALENDGLHFFAGPLEEYLKQKQ